MFWHEGTEGTAPYISWKIPESCSRTIFQGSSEWLQWKYPSKQKHDDNKALELLQLILYK